MVRSKAVRLGCAGGLSDGEAIVMIYDENHEPQTPKAGEIAITWIFAICLVCIILFVVGTTS